MNYKKILKEFHQNIDALKDFIVLLEDFLKKNQKKQLKSEEKSFDMLMLVMNKIEPERFKIDTKKIKELKKSTGIKEVKTFKKGTKTAIDFEGKDIDLSSFGSVITKLSSSINQLKLLHTSSLMSLVSVVEWFTNRIFHIYYETNQNPINHKEKFFSLEDLRKFNSLTDAENYLISSQVDSIMRPGFEKWYTSFENQNLLNLKLTYVKSLKSRITEIFQRRHLLVHNAGTINEFYLQKVEKSLQNGLKKGQIIKLDKTYLYNSADTLKLAFSLVFLELWRKNIKDSEERCDELITLAVKSLKDSKFKEAELYSQLLLDERNLNEHYKLIGQLNYWQSLKSQDRFDEIKEEVDNSDYSAKKDYYRMGYFAIKGDEKNFFFALEKIVKANLLTIEEVSTWQIFKPYLRKKKFKEIVKEIKK